MPFMPNQIIKTKDPQGSKVGDYRNYWGVVLQDRYIALTNKDGLCQ
jgi:hypothetical protein